VSSNLGWRIDATNLRPPPDLGESPPSDATKDAACGDSGLLLQGRSGQYWLTCHRAEGHEGDHWDHDDGWWRHKTPPEAEE